MKIYETIGIDISKLTMDVNIHSNKAHLKVDNSIKGFKKMIKWSYKTSSFSREEILFIFEHTGMYSYQLSVYLTQQGIPFAMVPGLAIKRSLGIARGKDDKLDSKNIALYGYRMREELKPTIIPVAKLQFIKSLLQLRERLVKQRAGYKASYNEYKRILVRKENIVLLETQEKMIHYLTKQIKKVDAEMKKEIMQDEQLKQMYLRIISIKGVGAQTALTMIVTTNGFTKFDTWRKYASYCGIAPFPNQSGSSIRGKTKISNLANKKIKSLLDLCARSSIQFNQEMKSYYNKRVSEGKNKKSVLNIIRNKLLARIFAVVNRNTDYVDIFKYAA